MSSLLVLTRCRMSRCVLGGSTGSAMITLLTSPCANRRALKRIDAASAVRPIAPFTARPLADVAPEQAIDGFRALAVAVGGTVLRIVRLAHVVVASAAAQRKHDDDADDQPRQGGGADLKPRQFEFGLQLITCTFTRPNQSAVTVMPTACVPLLVIQKAEFDI